VRHRAVVAVDLHVVVAVHRCAKPLRADDAHVGTSGSGLRAVQADRATRTDRAASYCRAASWGLVQLVEVCAAGTIAVPWCPARFAYLHWMPGHRGPSTTDSTDNALPPPPHACCMSPAVLAPEIQRKTASPRR
jgi:hypothetical protein